MAGVVIINGREDGAPAQALADKLGALGLETAFSLQGDDLRFAVNQADVVIALWSPHSYFRQELIDAAMLASRNGRVVHARMQNTPVPNAFEREHSIDLTGWRGEENFQPWRYLLNAISGVLYAPPSDDLDDSQFIMKDYQADYAERSREYAGSGYDQSAPVASAPGAAAAAPRVATPARSTPPQPAFSQQPMFPPPPAAAPRPAAFPGAGRTAFAPQPAAPAMRPAFPPDPQQTARPAFPPEPQQAARPAFPQEPPPAARPAFPPPPPAATAPAFPPAPAAAAPSPFPGPGEAPLPEAPAQPRHPLTPLTSYTPGSSSYTRPAAFVEPPRSHGPSLVRLLIIGLVTFGVVAGAGIGGYAYLQGSDSGSSETAWNALDKTDPYALRAFLDSGQAGQYREPAQATLDTLALDRLRVAREADTIEALQRFLAEFPDSRFASQVNGRIAELRLMSPDAANAPEAPPPALRTREPRQERTAAPSSRRREPLPSDAAYSPSAAAAAAQTYTPPSNYSPPPSASGAGPLTLSPPSVRDSPTSVEEELRRELSAPTTSPSEDDMRRQLQRGQ